MGNEMEHADVVELLKAAISPDKEILLDDGEFYIERNPNADLSQGNGFLKRRCKTTRQAPGGWDVIGGYSLDIAGKWRADINIEPPNRPDGQWEPEEECRVLGVFDNRLDAVAALWMERHDAHSRH